MILPQNRATALAVVTFWDIEVSSGLVFFRDVLYRTVFFSRTLLQCFLGHVQVDMVIHKLETISNCNFSVFMIAGSYCGFLPNAGHVGTACCGHHGTCKELREAFWDRALP